MKKRLAVLVVAVCFLLPGCLGAGGAQLADLLKDGAIKLYEKSQEKKDKTPEMGKTSPSSSYTDKDKR